MQVYLKTFAAWRTARQATAIASNLVIDSLDAENSSVTVDGTEIGNGNTGDWIIVDGMVYQLSAVKPQTDRTVLTLTNLIDSFSRPLELPETIPEGQTIGGFIKDVLTSNWILSDDPLFAIPYLTVVSDDATPFELPELDKSGLYVLSDYIRLMRRTHRITVTSAPTESGILCRIRTEPEVYRQITFNDGRSQIHNVSYSRSGQSKLTVLHDVDTGEKDDTGDKITVRERSTWYLASPIRPRPAGHTAAGARWWFPAAMTWRPKSRRLLPKTNPPTRWNFTARWICPSALTAFSASTGITSAARSVIRQSKTGTAGGFTGPGSWLSPQRTN